jgi:hypothetical protein
MPDSTVTIASLKQRQKQWAPMRATDDGRQIDATDEHDENASSLILKLD